MKKKPEPRKEITISDTAEIKWGNELVSGKWRLTSTELKMLYIMTANIDKEAEDFDCCRMSVADLGNFMGLSPDKQYQTIKSIANALAERKVTFESRKSPSSRIKQKSWVSIPWFSFIGYNSDCSSIEWEFNYLIAPLLLKVHKAYVKLSAKPLMAFDCIYSNRFLLLFCQWEKLVRKEISIAELKEHFEIQDKYKYFKDFRTYVVEPAIKEINALSDFNIQAEPIKTGRSYTHYRFIIKRKRAAKKKAIDVVGYPSEWTEEQEKLFKEISAHGVDQKFLKPYISERSIEDVQTNYKYALDHKNTVNKNFAGYLRKALEEDYGVKGLIEAESHKSQEQIEKEKELKEMISDLEVQAATATRGECLSREEAARRSRSFIEQHKRSGEADTL